MGAYQNDCELPVGIVCAELAVFLDEEQEELESKYGCPMVELDEDELLEIVEQFVKLTPESAKWEENTQGIKYKYQEECA